jgi:hypothetical protein
VREGLKPAPAAQGTAAAAASSVPQTPAAAPVPVLPSVAAANGIELSPRPDGGANDAAAAARSAADALPQPAADRALPDPAAAARSVFPPPPIGAAEPPAARQVSAPGAFSAHATPKGSPNGKQTMPAAVATGRDNDSGERFYVPPGPFSVPSSAAPSTAATPVATPTAASTSAGAAGGGGGGAARSGSGYDAGPRTVYQPPPPSPLQGGGQELRAHALHGSPRPAQLDMQLIRGLGGANGETAPVPGGSRQEEGAPPDLDRPGSPCASVPLPRWADAHTAPLWAQPGEHPHLRGDALASPASQRRLRHEDAVHKKDGSGRLERLKS